MEGGGDGDGGGDDDDVRRPGVKQREQRQKRFLPLDMVLEIAARSDPVTLVRCAATCRAARRCVANDQSFHRRLRLRHAGDGSFVPSLLRGHLVMLQRYHDIWPTGVEMHLVDVTGPDTAGATARLLSAAEGFPPNPDGSFIMSHHPLAWRDGLFLVRTTDHLRRSDELRVCDPATDSSHTLPPDPTFPGDDAEKNKWPRWQPYVLLGAGGGSGGGGDGGIRPCRVLKTNLVMSGEHHGRYLETRTFSSERGTWGTYTKISSAHLHGSALLRGGRPLVVGGAVHWLCLTDTASYVLRLDTSTMPERFIVMTLPASFPRDMVYGTDYLLATATAGGSLMVLVADSKKICAWVQTAATKMTTAAQWSPEVVVEYDAFLRFRNIACLGTSSAFRLLWFAERSGFVLVDAGFSYGYFWLDLRSKKIVRCFYDPHLAATSGTVFVPYEMDISSWVPTFTASF